MSRVEKYIFYFFSQVGRAHHCMTVQRLQDTTQRSHIPPKFRKNNHVQADMLVLSREPQKIPGFLYLGKLFHNSHTRIHTIFRRFPLHPPHGIREGMAPFAQGLSNLNITSVHRFPSAKSGVWRGNTLVPNWKITGGWWRVLQKLRARNICASS